MKNAIFLLLVILFLPWLHAGDDQNKAVEPGVFKAYAFGTLAMINMISGDNIAGNEYQDKATALDPYYSKAMGMPPEMLYCRPDEVRIRYSSFFMPF